MAAAWCRLGLAANAASRAAPTGSDERGSTLTVDKRRLPGDHQKGVTQSPDPPAISGIPPRISYPEQVLLAVFGSGVLGFRHGEFFGMDDGLVGGSAGGTKAGKLGFFTFALQYISCGHRLTALLIGDSTLDDGPVDAAAAVFALIGNILKSAVDRRLERVELLFDTLWCCIASTLAAAWTARTARTGAVAATITAAGISVSRPSVGSASLRLPGALPLPVLRSFPAVGGRVAAATVWRPPGGRPLAFGRLSFPGRSGLAAALRRAPTPAPARKLSIRAGRASVRIGGSIGGRRSELTRRRL
jgi:hypothetical protein